MHQIILTMSSILKRSLEKYRIYLPDRGRRAHEISFGPVQWGGTCSSGCKNAKEEKGCESTNPYLGDAVGSEGEDFPEPVPMMDLLNSNLASESIFCATRGVFSEFSSEMGTSCYQVSKYKLFIATLWL